MKLDIGYGDLFEIRRKECKAPAVSDFSVLYLSDFHFNKYSESITINIIRHINEMNPDIILLGGDYVDTKKGLKYFIKLLHFLSHRNNVFAVAGNHDYFFGIKTIEQVIVGNNIKWIEKKSILLNINDMVVQIDGNNLFRKNSESLFSILCLHKPINISHFKDNYDLAFGGHLHGCQLVLWQNNKGLFPGRLFYRWNLLETKLDNCQYIISKGLGDTLPIRYNCAKDMIFVNITSNAKLS